MLLLAAIAQTLDAGRFTATLSSFRWGFLVPALLADVLVLLLRGRRAQVLLPVGPPWRSVMSIVATTFVAGMLTPMRVGGLLRPWMLERRFQIPFGTGLAGIVAERLLDILSLLVLFGVASALGATDPALDPSGRLGEVRLLLGLAAAGGLVGFAVLLAMGPERVVGLARRLGGERVGGLAAAFEQGLRAMVGAPWRTAEAVLITVFMWLGGMSAAVWIMWGIPGVVATPAIIVTFWAAVMAANATVPTPASLGAYEAAGIAALGLFSFDPSVAAVIVLMVHLGGLLVQATFGGICFILDGGVNGAGQAVANGGEGD